MVRDRPADLPRVGIEPDPHELNQEPAVPNRQRDLLERLRADDAVDGRADRCLELARRGDPAEVDAGV